MDTAQDYTQLDQLPTLPTSPLDSLPPCSEEPESSSASFISTPAPIECKETILSEQEAKEPLRERSENSGENQETPEQEQKEEEEGSQGPEKINAYVARVLEKLVSQRKRMEKLSAILDTKGLLSEKQTSQVQNMIQGLEQITSEENHKNNEENAVNSPSKENMSPVKSRQKSASPKKRKHISQYSLEDVLQVSRSEIDYGYRFPGQVVEEHLEIINKSKHDFVVQIFVNCLNEELQDTEEYVYSVRRSHLYDYNDKHYLIMAPYSCAGFKFALKVPNMKLNGKIMGQIKIGVQGLNESYLLDMTTRVSIPRVFCPKELRFNGLDYSVIKLAIREGKKQEAKIPIKNEGNVPVTLELEFYEPKSNEGTQEKAMFDCMVHPNVITIAPNSSTLTSILVKPWRTLKALKDLEKSKPARKILVGKVRDSALVYSFVFWIEIY